MHFHQLYSFRTLLNCDFRSNIKHCIKHARIRVFFDPICPYTEEYGSVKTRILACFMQRRCQYISQK